MRSTLRRSVEAVCRDIATSSSGNIGQLASSSDQADIGHGEKISGKLGKISGRRAQISGAFFSKLTWSRKLCDLEA